MKLKKIAIMLLIALSINIIGAPFVFASSPKSTTITTIDTSTQNPNNTVQPQGKLKISKAALKKLLKALDSPINIQSIKNKMTAIGLGKYTGKLDNAVNGIKKEIGWLLEWAEVTETNLYNKLSGALYDAGLPLSAARLTAKAIIELFL